MSYQPDNLRVLPHDAQLEQHVLGGLMILGRDFSAQSEVYFDLADTLNADDFYKQDHRLIWNTISKLICHRKPADVATVMSTLKADGELESAGGFAYLVTIVKDTISPANVKTYGGMVKTLATRRRFIVNMGNLLEAAFTGKLEDKNALSALLEAAGTAVAQLDMEQVGGDGSITLKQAYKQAVDMIQTYTEYRGGVIGIDTGIASLNDTIGGFHNSDLIVVLARSGMGKTAYGMSIAKVAAKKSNVGFISTEMPAVQLGLRRLSQGSGVSMGNIRRGDLDEDHWARIAHTIKGDAETGLASRIRINDSVTELDDIKRQARLWKREFNLEILIIDYIQNIKVSNRRGVTGDRTAEVGAVSRELKDLAKQLNIPIIALTQAKQTVDERADKRPTNSDAVWAAQIENDADVMLGLYRHAKYHKDFSTHDTDVRNMAEIIILKNRHGELGTHYAVFHPQKADFLDAEESGVMAYLNAIADKPQAAKKSYAKHF